MTAEQDSTTEQKATEPQATEQKATEPQATEQAAAEENAVAAGNEVSERYARRQNLIAAAVIMTVGIVAVVMSASLGVGDLAEPEPGMWPMMISVVLVAMSAALLLQSGRHGDEQAFTRESLIVVVAVVSLLVYASLFERIGFEVPTVAVLLLWIKGLGRQSWLVSLAVSFGSCAVIYAVFISALGVPLPHIVVF
ncbi:hypothetical protein BJF85_03850 [Saccharomonospora sp. CUA-673]|uniref:tripartite tricarboxylate transporter TctB family protein n=1 Tax=Saccharomonospora sp. CUA-673 TaxID=1904969 RepID=UPI0009691C22|nr:tripartite tricarboxylate transporter TctB family protein [Saccharomonospora sp. CUA-673]OLT43180.1 hypothetical protein BJF85_03850 [Saccharomonospora sp. CUA-673]